MPKSFAEWKQKLSGFDKEKLTFLWQEKDRREDSYIMEPNFHLAIYERMLQLCHMAIDLSDEDRQKLAQRSAAIIERLRERNAEDDHQIEIINNVVAAAEDYFQTYGTRTARYYMFEQGIIDEFGDRMRVPERVTV